MTKVKGGKIFGPQFIWSFQKNELNSFVIAVIMGNFDFKAGNLCCNLL
jgi:hypothetical protein